MRFVDILLVEFDREAGLTRHVLERLPGDRFDWQPHPRSRTLGQLARHLAELPRWFPPWAAQLAELYFSGTTSAFVLHGNTYDYVRIGDVQDVRHGVLAEFLAEQLFGRWSLVLHYDLGRGLRAFGGRDEKRLKEMVTLANKKLGDLSALPKDPAATFAILDRFVRNNTIERFGPVREVEKTLVLEVAFDSIHESRRHKSGLAMRFPRISRIRTDKPAAEADTIETLKRMVT